jgi:EAL domain-containing protein (putative c-di-GMP-specific phosphodiesterase class I)
MTQDERPPGTFWRDTLDLEPGPAAELRESIRLPAAVGATGRWVLQSPMGETGELERTLVQPVPFTIGRAPGLALVLPSVHVSKAHAEIYSDGLALRIKDLGSRNGTFLNHLPVTDAPLHEGDALGIGSYEFRIMPDDEGLAEAADTQPLTRHIAAARVRELIDKEAVILTFQPIVTFGTGALVAYEVLGQGNLAGLPRSPVELFDLAGALGSEAQAELSRMMRRRAVEMVKDRPDPPLLFLNTHPADLERPGLLPSLQELRAAAPSVKLVLEVHESALADPEFIAWLRARLAAIEIGLAYDDFGAGQARLLELAEAPPDYLKFDRRFVTRIESAPSSRRRLVASLVAAARELMVCTVAEGVETAAEAAECQQAGFSHAQGYFFGRPGPLGPPGVSPQPVPVPAPPRES